MSPWCRAVNIMLVISYKKNGSSYFLTYIRRCMYINNAQQESHIINIPTIPMPPYEHMWVNHTQNFVDPTTNACTNQVESFWKRAKQKNKEINGTDSELLPSYLDEFQYRQIYGKKKVESFDNILAHIAHFYPVNNWFTVHLSWNYKIFTKNQVLMKIID